MTTLVRLAGALALIALLGSSAGAVAVKRLRPIEPARSLELEPPEDAPPTPLESELAQLFMMRPRADDFPAHASILRFEEGVDGLHHTLAVEVPLASLRVTADGEQFSARVQILVHLKNADGHVLRRFSVDRTISAASAAEVATQRLVWTGQVHLHTGRYTLEALVRDAKGGDACVRRVAFDSPETVPGVRIGSVAFLQPAGGNVVRDGAPDDDPLVLKGEPLMPTLQVKTAAGPAARLAFFTIVYPDRSSAEPLVMRVDLMRDREVVGSSNVPPAPPDERGAIRYAGLLPIEDLAPAEYRLRLHAQQGTSVSFEEATFTIVEGAGTMVTTRRPRPAVARAYAPSLRPLPRSGAASR